MNPRPKNPSQPPSTPDIRPKDIVVVEHAELFRAAFTHNPHPLLWGELRTWGPHPQCRWDSHSLSMGEHPEYGVLYTASDLLMCVAEVSADTRVIDIHSDMPLLQVWEATRPLRLLDLISTWALRNDASVSLDGALCPMCRAWVRAIRIQLPDVDGLRVRSTMTGGEMTVLLFPVRNSLPALPRDTASLADATLYALLKVLASDISYEIV